MVEFHYKQILPTFNTNKNENRSVKMLMSDTDSLVYWIELPPNTVYQKLKTEIGWMDFSNYNKSKRYSHFYNVDKYLTPGLFLK